VAAAPRVCNVALYARQRGRTATADGAAGHRAAGKINHHVAEVEKVERVTPIAAVEDIHAVGGISGEENVVARPAERGIGAIPDDQRVVAGTAVELVVTAVEAPAAVAVQHIMTVAPDERVVSHHAEERDVEIARHHAVIKSRAVDMLDAHQRGATRSRGAAAGELAGAQVQNDCAAHAGLQRIQTRAAVDIVVAVVGGGCGEEKPVLTCAAEKFIVAAGAVDGVVPAEAVDGVARRTPGKRVVARRTVDRLCAAAAALDSNVRCDDHGAALQRGDELRCARAVAVGVVEKLTGAGIEDDSIVGIVRSPRDRRPEARIARGEIAVRAERVHYRGA
jgi:hypothetical protein